MSPPTRNKTGKSAKMPQPVSQVRVEQVRRPLTLQDLPEEEKNKVARIVERLVSVVKEKDVLVSENLRLAEELDMSSAMARGHQDKMGQLEELQMSQQTGRATAIGMLHLYQSKVVQLATEAKAADLQAKEARESCEAMEGDITRLEALVDSQAASLCRGGDGSGAALEGVQSELAVCRAELTACRADMAEKCGAHAALEKENAEVELRVRELERLMTVAIDDAACASGAAGGAEEVRGGDGDDLQAVTTASDAALNNSLLNHSQDLDSGGGSASLLETDARFKTSRTLLAALSPKGSPQRKSVSTSPLPRDILAAHIGLLRESLQSTEGWPASSGGASMSLLRSSGALSRSSVHSSVDMGNGSQGKGSRPITRPGAGVYGQEVSPPRVPVIASGSKLLFGTASSSARAAAEEDAHRAAMSAAMPWSEQQALNKPPAPAPVPKVAVSRKKKGMHGARVRARKPSKKQESASLRNETQSRLAVRRAARARGSDDEGGDETGARAAGARRAPAAVVSKKATHTLRNSSESLLAAPSQRPPTAAVSPARSRASTASRSTFASVQARGRASSSAGAGSRTGTGAMPGLHTLSASHDRLYDVSLFNLVDELN